MNKRSFESFCVRRFFYFFPLCQRGNVIRYNHIHETLRFMPGADVRGIMLDDEYASAVIEHNVFYNVSSPCFLMMSIICADWRQRLLQREFSFMISDEYASVVTEHNVFYNVSSPSCFLMTSIMYPLCWLNRTSCTTYTFSLFPLTIIPLCWLNTKSFITWVLLLSLWWCVFLCADWTQRLVQRIRFPSFSLTTTLCWLKTSYTMY